MNKLPKPGKVYTTIAEVLHRALGTGAMLACFGLTFAHVALVELRRGHRPTSPKVTIGQ